MRSYKQIQMLSITLKFTYAFGVILNFLLGLKVCRETMPTPVYNLIQAVWKPTKMYVDFRNTVLFKYK